MGAKKYIEYAVTAYRGNEKVYQGKKRYLRAETAESRASVFFDAYTPEVLEFLDSKDWKADLQSFLDHSSTPSENLLKFKRAGGYILSGQDPVTGEIMFYIGSTGCLARRYEEHITEIMRGLSKCKYDDTKWFYNWCVKHNTIPKCIVAWYEDSDHYETHFNELAESILITLFDTMSDYPDGNCFEHFGHVQNARDEELPEVAWQRGNNSLPAMMPHSTKPYVDREYELRQCDACDFQCYQLETLEAHNHLEHIFRREALPQPELTWTATKTASVPGQAIDSLAFVQTDGQKSSCQYCEEEFVRLHDHEPYCPENPDQTAREARKTVCQFCPKEYSRKSDAVKHEKTCSENPQNSNRDKKSKCQHCHKEYVKSNIVGHEKKCSENPNGDEKRKCQHCQKEFLNKANVVQHEKTCSKNPNRDEKPKCQHCQKEFTQTRHAGQHEKSCSKNPDRHEAKIPCQFCQAEYSRKSDVVRHEKTCSKNPNGDEKPKCQHCQKEFSTKAYAVRHEETCSKNPDRDEAKTDAVKHEKTCPKKPLTLSWM
jgi:hypothetical protein